MGSAQLVHHVGGGSRARRGGTRSVVAAKTSPPSRHRRSSMRNGEALVRRLRVGRDGCGLLGGVDFRAALERLRVVRRGVRDERVLHLPVARSAVLRQCISSCMAAYMLCECCGARRWGQRAGACSSVAARSGAARRAHGSSLCGRLCVRCGRHEEGPHWYEVTQGWVFVWVAINYQLLTTKAVYRHL